MRTKKLMTTALAALFSMVLAVNGFAAGRRQGGNETSSGLVTLDVYSGPANTSGVPPESYATAILKEDLGIQLNLLPQNRDLFNAMMASGELADVVVVHDYAQTEDMIRAGLLLNLDDHRVQLPNAFANIPTALQFMRDNVSNGTGGLYAVPNNVTSRPQQSGYVRFSTYLRWDFYKEMGMPVINDFEDFLPIIKKMVDTHPVNEEGQKVYGLIGWNDWDGNTSGATMYLSSIIADFLGGEHAGETNAFLEIDYVNNITRSLLDDNSYYKRGLKFWFAANQMGLVDPDSVTQTSAEAGEKATAGRSVFALGSWGYGSFNTRERAEQGIGFVQVPFTRQIVSLESPTYAGGTWSYHIAKNTKKLDAALRFLDYMCSYDGTLNLSLGRKGVYWDQDSSGEPYITQLGWEINTGARDFPNGGRLGVGLSFLNSNPLSTRNIHPALNRELSTSDWIKKDFAPPDTALTAEWKSTMNALDDMDYFIRHNKIVQKPFAPMNAPPENILQIAARVGQVIQPLSWQMVYARDEAEFNRIWADMVQRAKGVGIDTVVQWYADEYNRARTRSAKYAN
jgi:putative aldouronate transport system substrate-binding protein